MWCVGWWFLRAVDFSVFDDTFFDYFLRSVELAEETLNAVAVWDEVWSTLQVFPLLS
jgi:hypothetical protein